MSRRRQSGPANPQSAVPDASAVTFRFANLGPVREAFLRPGRLTVVAGRNNTGKTYIAHMLFGFLQAWRQWPGALNMILEHPQVFPDVLAAAESLFERGRAAIPLGDAPILEQRRVLADELGRAFSEQNTSGVMGSRTNRFEGATLSLAVDKRELPPMPSRARVRFDGATLDVGRVGNKAVISIDEAESDDPDPAALPSWTATAYCFFLLHDLLPPPVALSADRVGISLFAEDLDFMKDRLVDLLVERVNNAGTQPDRPFLVVGDIPGRYPLPVLENIDSTRRMSALPRLGGLASGRAIADDIKRMAGGYFSHARDPIRFISQKRGGKFNVPLRLASSSARGMADLYFFARHASVGREFLIIDTPESHLDTENQVTLARVLAELVREGLHLLVTTHSPFPLKELNNLIMLHGDSLKKLDLARSLGYKPRDGLDPRLVRAYIAENGGLTPARVDDFGISLPFLDATAQKVSRAADLLGDLVREEARGE